MRRCASAALWGFLVAAASAHAAVTNVTITSRSVVADGHAFGATGSYEKLIGRIEFALDPADPHNTGIVDLQYAPRGADGRVYFSAELFVLQPTETAKGNGVLLFGVPNRGAMILLNLNRAAANRDPTTLAELGDGLLMREGYTLVNVGWELDVPPPGLRIDAPRAQLPAEEPVEPLGVDIIVNERAAESFLIDEALRPSAIYPPADPLSAADMLTVRNRFWDPAETVPRDRWRFASAPNGLPKIVLDGGFDPGRMYRVTYRASAPRVAGAGLAALRDAASAFRHRTDLPVRGRSAYAFGISQTGRFLREFLYDGFNVDEQERRVFDALWIHIAGAARGSFNMRFAVPAHGDMFAATRFPFADQDEADVDGTRDGLESRYPPKQRPKVFYTNTPVEYWGGGRAAALTHTAVDGARDLTLPDNVRMYFLAGTQHSVSPFPPARTPPTVAAAAATRGNPAARADGQQLSNPLPQMNVMRALLPALHEWVTSGKEPPPSRYPRLADDTLVPIEKVGFPALPGVADPRRIVGPARVMRGKVVPLPHLVPQVDRDGNDVAGIRDPELAVPLATTTGWNFRAERIGNPSEIYPLLGSYIPFAATRAAREASGDPRPSIEERYKGYDDYASRVRAAAQSLIHDRYLLEEDLEWVLERARSHWDYATRDASSVSGGR
jgi:hypothetical protein